MMRKKIIIGIISLLLVCGCTVKHEKRDDSSAKQTDISQVEHKEKKYKSFGYFIGLRHVSSLKGHYHRIVIDTRYFTSKEISSLRDYSNEIYSYISVGTLSKSDKDYSKYKKLTNGQYQSDPNTYRMKVSKKKWRKYIYKLAKKAKKKGVDGVVLDHFDIYTSDKQVKRYKYLKKIVKNINMSICIFNGDRFMTKYLGEGLTKVSDVGETHMFTTFNESTGKTTKQKSNISSSLKDYLGVCKNKNLGIYVVECTRNNDWIAVIKAYCKSHDYHYYISPTLKYNLEKK